MKELSLYMPLFRACKTLKTLTQLHSHLLTNNLHRNRLALTKLTESYAHLGSLSSAHLVFRTFPNPDTFMYCVLIKCCVWSFSYKDAIFLYNEMVFDGFEVNNFVYPSVLRACSTFRDLGIGRKVHGRVVKSGFGSDFVVETSLVSMYGEGDGLVDALKVFDEMCFRDVVTWTSVISSCVRNGRPKEGLRLFGEMMGEGNEPDSVVVYIVAEACGELGLVKEAKTLHGYVLTKGIQSDGSLENSLVAMYGKCGDLYSSKLIFEKIVRRSTSLWTAMIMCYNHNGCYKEAVDTFVRMQGVNVEPNVVTLIGVSSSCARLGLLRIGKSTHCYVIRKLLDADYDFVRPALIDLYANCGSVRSSQILFNDTESKDTILWNMIISGYARVWRPNKALMLFRQMHSLGKISDSYTLASVLSACGDICLSEFGNQIHGHIFKTGIFNEYVLNALIDMYSKCGLVNSALVLFDNNEKRSSVTWNSMIGGLSKNGKFLEAVSLFYQMHMNGLEMDEVTFLLAIQACSNLGYLKKGKWIHHKLIIYGMPKDMYIDTALTDLYAKCGDLHMARRVFDTMLERTVVTWTAIIAGCGLHGDIDTAISLFDKMVNSGIKPNEVTFLSVLSACSHAGFVEKGKFYFNSTMKDFGINPTLEHFSCMVDLLSRAGDIDEAYKIISTMPYSVDAGIWGALLNGCQIYRRTDIIKRILKKLMELETDDTGYYTLISNIFAEGGDWDEFKTVRSMMRNAGLNKAHGYSAIEVDKRVQTNTP